MYKPIERVILAIPKGKDNAIKSADLMQKAKLECSDRQLKYYINQLRNVYHIEICSDTKSGYYLPINKAERQNYINFMKKSALNRIKTARPSVKAREEIQGQVTIDDYLYGNRENDR